MQYWPEDALEDVARHKLQEAKLTEEEMTNCLKMFQLIHKSAMELALKKARKGGTVLHVTPGHYKELVHVFKALLEKKTRLVSSCPLLRAPNRR